VHRLHSLADAVRLDSLLGPGARVLVLGSGFVALQAAWAAHVRGSAVTVYESAPRILPRVLDESNSERLCGRIESHGVRVVRGVDTVAVEHDRTGSIRVVARGRAPLTVDGVIVATGVRPNDGLVRDALALDVPGVPVSATMETGLEGIFAAGDAVRGPTAAGGPDEVHALWSTAVEHGRIAGANMAGAALRYEGSLSMNVTEMFGATVASMGTFVPEPGDDVVDVPRRSSGAHLRIVRRAGVPVGAIAIGGPEEAALLGRLRPYIRRRWPLDGVEELQRPHERESVRCAS
jgi:NADPH-dependent 2,4-dienoyl-CoA reductase/sulfur reductase-like enzyme